MPPKLAALLTNARFYVVLMGLIHAVLLFALPEQMATPRYQQLVGAFDIFVSAVVTLLTMTPQGQVLTKRVRAQLRGE